MRNRVLFVSLFVLFLFVTVNNSEAAVKSAGNSGIIKKKIVFVKDDNSEFFNGFTLFIQNEFEKHGWTKENSEFIVLSMDGKIEKAKENIEEIKKIKPDVVYINGTYVADRVVPLKGSGIPIVLISAIDLKINGKQLFLDSYGNPNSNVTGLYLYTKNFEKNSMKLLNKIAPIKKKKVVMLGQPGMFDKEVFEKVFREMKIELKHYEEYRYFEDFQKDFNKYNSDKEVGWMIVDGPITRKDGKEWTRKDTFLWEHSNIKKPNIAFFQNNVEQGALCGIAIDPMGYVMPSLELAYKILEGKKPSEIKPVYPDKSLVLINQKAARQIGLNIPIEIMKSAWRIYTDYEGHYEEKK